MNIPSQSGTAPFTLSVLDNALTSVGETATEGLQGVIDLASAADKHGYHRFWLSEHHAMPAAATSSPQMMLSRLIPETTNIRLGAGGVMLPNHSSLMVAEQFGMLEALAPGRIDLGLGRAPGTDGATADALRRHQSANEHFPQQVLELLGFMQGNFPADHRYSNVHAVPGPWQAKLNRVPGSISLPETWILGSSNYSASLAGQLGRPYAFALQFGDSDVDSALELYRKSFRPSGIIDKPHTLVSVLATAADDAEEARRQALSNSMAMLQMFKREPFVFYSPEEIEQYNANPHERQVIESYVNKTYHGTPPQVAERLEQLHERTQADELMMVVSGYGRKSLNTTVELMAKHYGMSGAN
ncbi:LLM class flavin-dependent oxidoreductase [Corynebacterium ammoniagenes]|uniref:MsnO8 family LLM class oxidoreductase n=1 Tax=Corynebacterium ammoniagenes TaxID=1697 RepID=UPI0014595B51|nr:LLM class flavin-dependent oxidoreductase [Corynebacterium ammoniagenes]